MADAEKEVVGCKVRAFHMASPVAELGASSGLFIPSHLLEGGLTWGWGGCHPRPTPSEPISIGDPCPYLTLRDGFSCLTATPAVT